jgi:hypothetical protein
MALTVCSLCKQHIIDYAACVHCTLTSKPVVNLAVPLALLMGLGCHPKAPEPDVMALYGGPPVEFEPVDQSVDEGTESTDKDAASSTTNKPTETDSTQERSSEQGPDKISEPKLEAIEHMQALYGVPNVILEPLLEEIKEKNQPEDNDDLDVNEDD